MDLSTTYLGMRLPHPLIVGAGPLGEHQHRLHASSRPARYSSSRRARKSATWPAAAGGSQSMSSSRLTPLA